MKVRNELDSLRSPQMQTLFRARFFLAAAISQLLLSIHHFHTSSLPLPPFGGLGNLGKEGPCWPLPGTPLVQTRPPGGEMKRLRWGDRAGGSLCQGRSPLLAHNQNRVGQHPSADLRLRFRRRPDSAGEPPEPGSQLQLFLPTSHPKSSLPARPPCRGHQAVSQGPGPGVSLWVQPAIVSARSWDARLGHGTGGGWG